MGSHTTKPWGSIILQFGLALKVQTVRPGYSTLHAEATLLRAAAFRELGERGARGERKRQMEQGWPCEPNVSWFAGFKPFNYLNYLVFLSILWVYFFPGFHYHFPRFLSEIMEWAGTARSRALAGSSPRNGEVRRVWSTDPETGESISGSVVV